MRQAIITKYLGPTETKGARVKAKAYAGNITINWDDGLDVNENHYKAALALCEKLEWRAGELIGGGMPDNTGNVYLLK